MARRSRVSRRPERAFELGAAALLACMLSGCPLSDRYYIDHSPEQAGSAGTLARAGTPGSAGAEVSGPGSGSGGSGTSEPGTGGTEVATGGSDAARGGTTETGTGGSDTAGAGDTTAETGGTTAAGTGGDATGGTGDTAGWWGSAGRSHGRNSY